MYVFVLHPNQDQLGAVKRWEDDINHFLASIYGKDFNGSDWMKIAECRHTWDTLSKDYVNQSSL